MSLKKEKWEYEKQKWEYYVSRVKTTLTYMGNVAHFYVEGKQRGFSKDEKLNNPYEKIRKLRYWFYQEWKQLQKLVLDYLDEPYTNLKLSWINEAAQNAWDTIDKLISATDLEETYDEVYILYPALSDMTDTFNQLINIIDDEMRNMHKQQEQQQEEQEGTTTND